MAAALLRQHLDDLGLAGVTVSSAGRLESGTRAERGAVRAVATRGLRLDDHRSETLSPELVRAADLVLCMAREHVRDVVVLDPDVFGRTFTLKELVRRGEAVGPRQLGAPMADWLARVHDGRSTAGLLGESADDDIADPIGRPDAAFERTAAELDALLGRLLRLAVAR
jgi:protein-tyrosine-phosphatase